MYRYALLAFFVLACCSTAAQSCRLNAQYEERTSSALLSWNMISHAAKTTYVLLKSADSKAWVEVVTEKPLQNYTTDDVFDYADKVYRNVQYFYRIKIIDASNKTIAFSNIMRVTAAADKISWVIYPNPVNDVLSLLYKGNNVIKGVINVTVKDVSGKIITRFRAASNNRKLEIPVSQYRKGIYLVQVSIMNEMVMNQKFVKQ